MSVAVTIQKLLGFARMKPSTFNAMRRDFEARLPRWRSLPAPPAEGPRVGVLVTPWLATAVPFFNLECALKLALEGCRVTVLWDCTDLTGNAARRDEISAIRRALSRMPAHVELIDVAERPAVGGPGDAALSAAILYEHAVWRMRGEMSVAKFYGRHPEAMQKIEAHLRKVRALLASSDFRWLLFSGGIYGVTPIYAAMAKEAGLPFTSYDCGYGMLLLAHGGVAAHQPDVGRSLALAREWLAERPRERARAIQLAHGELHARMGGKGNYFNFQTVPMQEGAPDRRVDALVALNLRWDAAALSRQKIFPTVEAWLTALVQWANELPGFHLWIRQHPVERHENWRTTDDVAGLIARHNRAPERIRFVAAADPVNTYELLQAAKVVLPHSSSVGVEAAMLGKPVVLAMHTYYEHLAGCWQVASPQEYHAQIQRAVRGELAVSPAAREEAALVYYLTQECNLMRTCFTAEPRDFAHWRHLPPEQLWNLPEMLDLSAALLTRAPLSFLRLRRAAQSWDRATQLPSDRGTLAG